MGTEAGLTYHFTISGKLRCQDPLTITTQETTVKKRVQTWIEEDPNLVWLLVYGKGVQKSTKLSLCRDALTLLKTKIAEVNPSLLVELDKRKQGYAIKKKLTNPL